MRVAIIRLENEGVVRARAIDRLDGDGDHDVGAEFLRLNEGAGGERLAADSGRKAEVVLDPGAGAGLPAESAGVENRDRQAFGAGVDRGREARGPGADDRDVIDEVRSGWGRQADLMREGGLRGIAEHRAVGTDHQRQSSGDIGVTGDHHVGLGILRRIEQMVRIAVPGEKALKPDHVGCARCADQHGAGRAALQQSHPPKNERPHDALAELGFGDQKGTQALGRDQQGLDVALGRSVDKRRARGKLADVGEKLTLALLGDRRQMAQAVALGQRHQALEHDEHAGTDLSRFEQFLAVRIFAHRPVAPQSVDLRRGQRGKRLLVARQASSVDGFGHASRLFGR